MFSIRGDAPMSDSPNYQAPVVRSAGPLGPIALVLVVLVGAATGYLYYQVNQTRTEMAQMRDQVLDEISKIHETSAVTTQTSRKSVEQLKTDVEAARRQASQLAGQAKEDAEKHAEDLAATLRKAQAEQAARVTAMSAEVGQVKDQANAANARIGEVSTDVGNVKTDVAATRSELEKTIATLKATQGDLGVQSGLIATNGKELAALRALGERNYVEFKISKAKAPQKVGDISVLLEKADPKNNRYTIKVIADDKTVQKRDKTLNEPVQFLLSRASQPYELVVNEVRKDMISGYVASPKVQAPRGNSN
jgi:chromosome segregation ATPase